MATPLYAPHESPWLFPRSDDVLDRNAAILNSCPLGVTLD
jgi:hypothetical protein